MSILGNSENDIFYKTAKENNIPSHGWRVRLDHKFTSNFKPNQLPTFSQIIHFLYAGLRTLFHVIYEMFHGRKPVMNPFRPIPLNPIYGCPIGGIGSGSIGRGYCGQFTRFCLRPGIYEYNTVKANQFIVTIRRDNLTTYQSILSIDNFNTKYLSSWKCAIDPSKAFYTALYPRAWTYYDIPEERITLICKQISPVIPHNYKDSSLPASAFVWKVKNHGSQRVEVSITFCFKNGTADDGSIPGNTTETRINREKGNYRTTIAIHHKLTSYLEYSYGISTVNDNQSSITGIIFDPCSDGGEVWNALRDRGEVDEIRESDYNFPSMNEVAVGLCNRVGISGNSTSEIVFSLNWNMPSFSFRDQNVKYLRRYTEWFGTGKDGVFNIGDYVLENYPLWNEEVEKWQTGIINRDDIPAWYKSVLFNELYYVSDGGSVWTSAGNEPEDSRGVHLAKYGRFCYLEGHEYRMYNTYDVHAYASYAFIHLWPQLQISMQYDYATCINMTIMETRWFLNGSVEPIKTACTTPHDLGNPEHEPWVRINSYNAYPTDFWKDLNSLFVILSYRDYCFVKNIDHLIAVAPIIECIVYKQLGYTDHTCLMVSSENMPDNTFDTCTANGYSVYINSLWLTALWCYIKIMEITGKDSKMHDIKEVLKKGQESFADILFNGEYFDYCSRGENRRCIFAAQLVGYWMLKSVNAPENEVFRKHQVDRALDKLIEFNVKIFGDFKWGVVNAMSNDGSLNRSSPQSDEIWIGITCSIAALLVYQRRNEEGFAIIKGMYERLYQDIGMMFQTPEAIIKKGYYRSLGYMRGLTIWAVQCALDSIDNLAQ